MDKYSDQTLFKILEQFRLEALPCMADLKVLARPWGVTSIEEREIESEAMLLPSKDGYSIVLKKAERPSRLARQRFSLAHELGHLLLQKSEQNRAALKYRGHGYSDDEERICDQIAAEILMPRMAFYEDGWMEGWSLRSLRSLAVKYDTSVPATAMRMIDLMPEEALMGVWKVSGNDGESAKLQWAHAGKTAYRVPSGSVSSKRLALVTKAWNSGRVESSAAPVQDSRFEKIRLLDVPAEAMAWGRGEYKQVLVYYYPGRVQEYKVG